MAVTKYLYDGDTVLQEYDGLGATLTEYTSTGRGYGDVLSAYDGSAAKYYEPDALGSTDALADQSQAVVDRWKYRAFGGATQTAGTDATPFTWVGRQGYYADSETGLYQLGNGTRYYDPAAAQFLSDDPIRFAGADPNLRRYALNSPVRFLDPMGLRADESKKLRDLFVDFELEDYVITPLAIAVLNLTCPLQDNEVDQLWSFLERDPGALIKLKPLTIFVILAKLRECTLQTPILPLPFFGNIFAPILPRTCSALTARAKAVLRKLDTDNYRVRIAAMKELRLLITTAAAISCLPESCSIIGALKDLANSKNKDLSETAKEILRSPRVKHIAFLCDREVEELTCLPSVHEVRNLACSIACS